MAKFGQYLCGAGALTESQLEEALSHQSVYGARLGSNLVELRMLSIEQLAEHLGAYHRARLPPRAWLERPRRAALKKVTRPLVERFRFIPLRLEGNVMHAAVLDPADPGALDDLRFATGCRVQAYVLPEIWMHDWLLTLFRVPRGIRHISTSAAVVPGVPGVPLGAPPAPVQTPVGLGHGAAAPSDSSANIPQDVSGFSTPGAFGATGSVGGQASRPDGESGTVESGTVPGMAPITMEKLASALNSGMVGALAPKSSRRTSGQQGAVQGGAAPAKEASQAHAAPGATSQAQERPELPAGSDPSGPHAADRAANQDAREPGSELPAMSLEAPVIGGRKSSAERDTGEESALDGASVRPPPIEFAALDKPQIGPATPSGSDGLVTDPFSTEAADTASPASFTTSVLSGAFVPAIQDTDADYGTTEEPSVVRSRFPAAMAPTPPAQHGALRLAKAESLISSAKNREHMLEQAFLIGGTLVSHFSLFIVQQGTIQGGGAVIKGERSDNSGVLVSVDTPCVLTQAAASSEGGRLAPEAGGLDGRLLQLLGDEGCQEACLFPVVIKRRVVNVLFASNGTKSVGPIVFAALEQLALQMGEGYLAIIRARKSAG